MSRLSSVRSTTRRTRRYSVITIFLLAWLCSDACRQSYNFLCKQIEGLGRKSLRSGPRIQSRRLDLLQADQISQCVTEGLAPVCKGCGHDSAEMLAHGKCGFRPNCEPCDGRPDTGRGLKSAGTDIEQPF